MEQNNILLKNKGIGYAYLNKLYAANGISIKRHKISTIRQYDLASIKIEQEKLSNLWYNKINSIKKAAIERKTYKGVRYSKGLPCRGQRTHTNAKTSRKLKLKVNVE